MKLKCKIIYLDWSLCDPTSILQEFLDTLVNPSIISVTQSGAAGALGYAVLTIIYTEN